MKRFDITTQELPDFLTVEEAAAILRIGRTAAYEQTRRYEDSDGQEGIPVIRVGRLMRVPRTALERWSGGPLSPVHQPPAPEQPAPPTRHHTKPRLTQDGLPFGKT